MKFINNNNSIKRLLISILIFSILNMSNIEICVMSSKLKYNNNNLYNDNNKQNNNNNNNNSKKETSTFVNKNKEPNPNDRGYNRANLLNQRQNFAKLQHGGGNANTGTAYAKDYTADTTGVKLNDIEKKKAESNKARNDIELLVKPKEEPSLTTKEKKAIDKKKGENPNNPSNESKTQAKPLSNIKNSDFFNEQNKVVVDFINSKRDILNKKTNPNEPSYAYFPKYENPIKIYFQDKLQKQALYHARTCPPIDNPHQPVKDRKDKATGGIRGEVVIFDNFRRNKESQDDLNKGDFKDVLNIAFNQQMKNFVETWKDPTTIQDVIKAYRKAPNEKQGYNDFTQMIWQKALSVGCAFCNCNYGDSIQTVYVCMFNEGNIVGAPIYNLEIKDETKKALSMTTPGSEIKVVYQNDGHSVNNLFPTPFAKTEKNFKDVGKRDGNNSNSNSKSPSPFKVIGDPNKKADNPNDKKGGPQEQKGGKQPKKDDKNSKDNKSGNGNNNNNNDSTPPKKDAYRGQSDSQKNLMNVNNGTNHDKNPQNSKDSNSEH